MLSNRPTNKHNMHQSNVSAMNSCPVTVAPLQQTRLDKAPVGRRVCTSSCKNVHMYTIQAYEFQRREPVVAESVLSGSVECCRGRNPAAVAESILSGSAERCRSRNPAVVVVPVLRQRLVS